METDVNFFCPPLYNHRIYGWLLLINVLDSSSTLHEKLESNRDF